MSLADAFHRWRARRVADPAFQAWAARFPLTRGIARRKAAGAFDLVAGFVYSQVLAAAVETGLLERAREGPLDAGSLAESGLAEAGAQRLLRAAAAIGLLRRESDGRYGLGETGAALIGNPSVFAMIRHHRVLYADLAEPAALLRERRGDTELARFWAYAPDAGTEAASAYSALMAATQALIARDVLAAHDFSRHRHLMDVGGGLGVFLEAAGRENPGLALTVFDLPGVVQLAGERLAGTPVAGRVRCVSGNFMEDALPEGADLITLIRVVHDHDDGPVRALLARVRAALPPGGQLLIAEPMAGIRGAERMGDAYFGLYLWAMGRGRARRPDELRALLKEAGFGRIRQVPTPQPLLLSVLAASAV